MHQRLQKLVCRALLVHVLPLVKNALVVVTWLVLSLFYSYSFGKRPNELAELCHTCTITSTILGTRKSSMIVQSSFLSQVLKIAMFNRFQGLATFLGVRLCFEKVNFVKEYNIPKICQKSKTKWRWNLAKIDQ